MRQVILSMSMSLDGHVDSDRQHPGALPEDPELVQWRLDWMKGAAGALASEIAAIKEEPGPDVIAWGGAEFAEELAAHDLIDEYRLAVQPVAVGSGKPLFGRLPEARYLHIVEAKSLACGVVVHIYRPQAELQTDRAPAGGTAEEG